jgi:hypothetical protein
VTMASHYLCYPLVRLSSFLALIPGKTKGKGSSRTPYNSPFQQLRGSRSPFNQFKGVARLRPLRNMLDMSKAGSERHVEDVAENPALKHLSKYQLDILENYQEMFGMADTSGTGRLNLQGFMEFLQSTGAAISAEQAEQIFKISDIDDDGSVSWEEFEQVTRKSVYACICVELRVHQDFEI